MWGNFAKLAERAATAAEAIESQMNDSVGAPKPKPRPTSIATTSYSDSYNNLNSVDEHDEGDDDDDDVYDTNFDDNYVFNTTTSVPPSATELKPVSEQENKVEEMPVKSGLKVPFAPITSTTAVKKLPASPVTITNNNKDEDGDGDLFYSCKLPQEEKNKNETVIETKVNENKNSIQEDIDENNDDDDNAWVVDDDNDIEDIELNEEQICFTEEESKIKIEEKQVVSEETQKIKDDSQNNAPPPPTTTTPSPSSSNNNDNEELIKSLLSEIDDLKSLTKIQETQLTSQAQSLSTMTQEHYNEKSNLESQILHVKEEAKKRIARAKDRVHNATNDLQSKDKVIDELRSEGDKLSIAKGTIEQLCRQAKNEVRELQTYNQELNEHNSQLQSKLSSTKSEVDALTKELNDAKKYIEKCATLEHTVHMLKEENTTFTHQKQTQEQQIQQLKHSLQEYQQEYQQNDALKQIESSKKIENIHKEKDDIRSDLERKLRLQEREANAREDALRNEMEELRKRWQDAVRRADVLTMDAQNSTAPLVRQLESTERSMRVRASTAAELEQKLRKDLEEKIVEHDAIMREKNELTSQVMILSRKLHDEQLNYETKSRNQDKALETQLQSLTQSMNTLKTQNDEYHLTIDELQHSVMQYEKNASVMKEYILQKETIQELTMQVKVEEGKRIELERQLTDLQTHHTNNYYYSNDNIDENIGNNTTNSTNNNKLHEATNQADILKHLVDDDDDDDHQEQEQAVGENSSSTSNSFAAIEQLTQNLSNAMQEIHTLRTQLQTSEAIRTKLQEQMNIAKTAQEKLPFFEAKVLELTNTLAERELETKALHEDILDIKEMYRSQLDVLLEEKAAWLPKVDVADVVEKEVEIGEDMAVNLEIAFNGDIVA